VNAGQAPASELPRPRWSTVLACFLALLIAGIALSQLQGLLQGMHVSGSPSVSIGGLNDLLDWGGNDKATSDALKVWHGYQEATPGLDTAGVHEVARWAVWMDALLFAPLYLIVFVLFFWRVRAQLKGWLDGSIPYDVTLRLASRGLLSEADADLAVESGSDPVEVTDRLRLYRFGAAIGIGLIIVGFVADEIENLKNHQLVDFGLQLQPDYMSDRFHDLVTWLWISGSVKWSCDLLAVVLALLLAWVLLAESTIGERWKTVRPQLHLLRLQLIVGGVIAVLPFAHEQIPDLILRLSPTQLAATLVLLWTLAFATWRIGRRLLICGQWQPKWDVDQAAKYFFCGLLGLAVLQGLAWLVFDGSYRLGWGLLVPAVIVTALAGLGWLLPKQPPSSDMTGAPLAPTVTHPRLPRLLAAGLVVAFGLGVLRASFGYSVYAQNWTLRGYQLAALGLVLTGVVVAAVLGKEPLAGLLVGTAAGVGVLRWSNSEEIAPSVLVAVGLLLVILGCRLYWALLAVEPPAIKIRWRLVALSGLVLAVGYAVVVALPFWTGEQLGGVGILMFFALVLTCVGSLVVWISPALPVPRALRVLGIARFPVVLLLVAWFAVASWRDGGGYHNVRLLKVESSADGVTLDKAFDCWLAKNGLDQIGSSGPDDGSCGPAPAVSQPTSGAVPLILVATTGGGIRAAYWTSLVLDCAFEVEATASCPSGTHSTDFARSDRVFALSGISGGSLGLASYAAYLSEKEKPGGVDDDWVNKGLEADALSASGAWWLFVELPRAFLQFRSPTDRAGILERGWERQWDDGELERGLLELWRTRQHQPLLLLNGTSVEDGCRFETSPLDANVEMVNGSVHGCHSTEVFDFAGGSTGASATKSLARRSVLPATRDLVDFLCGDKEDVRLSTAALLSARFPFVNPSARVENRCKQRTSTAPVAYVVDGGYLDTSGASPVVELMTRLQPLIDLWNADHGTIDEKAGSQGKQKRCIVPVMIQIDNGFVAGAPRSPGRPGELLIPLKTAFATRGAREAEGRVGAALLFAGTETGAPDHYAHFVNEAHPGPKAPLGWTQSKASERELSSQLTAKKNGTAFEEVRQWLRPRGLECP
jgi:patatin-like phospholipase